MKFYLLDGYWPVYTEYLNGYCSIDEIVEERLRFDVVAREIDAESARDYINGLVKEHNRLSPVAHRRHKKMIQVIEKQMFYKDILND
jgi:hypothetical protein